MMKHIIAAIAIVLTMTALSSPAAPWQRGKPLQSFGLVSGNGPILVSG